MLVCGFDPRFRLSVNRLDRVLKCFPAIAALRRQPSRKVRLLAVLGGCKRHAEFQNLVRQRPIFWSKSSNVQHVESDALVAW